MGQVRWAIGRMEAGQCDHMGRFVQRNTTKPPIELPGSFHEPGMQVIVATEKSCRLSERNLSPEL